MRTWVGLACSFALGCGPTLEGADAGDPTGSTSSGPSATTDAHSDTTGSAEVTGSPATSTGGSSTSGMGSTTAPTCDRDDGLDDGGPKFDLGPIIECDLFAQDCERGFKCVPEGFWTRICEPIPVEPLPDGSPCLPNIDDPCGPLSWCTPAGPTGQGTCVRLCTGSFDEPVCPADTICVIDDEQIVAYCAPPCDPFDAATCDFGACLPTPQGFGCVPTGERQTGDPCAQDDSCVFGNLCRSGDTVAGCCTSACCTPMCSDEHPCAAGECIPLDPPIPGPPGIGACAS